MKYPSGKSIFALNLPLKLFPATVTNADIGSLKSLHVLFDMYLDHILVKFKQNCVVPTTRNFELSDQKKNRFFFSKSVDAILKDVSEAEQLFNTKLLLSRLSSSSVPNIMVVRQMQPG